jgi:hypothetical protein
MVAEFEGQRSRDLMGVLGTAAPGAVLQGVLEQQMPQQTQAAPNTIREMAALGIPQTPEGFAQYQQLKNPTNLSQELQDILTGLQIRGLQNEQDQEQREREEAGQRRVESAQSMLDLGLSTIRALEGSEDAVLAKPGSALGDTGRDLASVASDLAGMFGMTDTKERLGREVQNFDTVSKNQNLLVGSMLEQAQASGITPTRALQQLYENSTPGSDIHKEVSLGIVADLLEKSLADGKELRGAKEAREWLKSRRAPKFDTEAAAEEALREGKVNRGQTVFINGLIVTGKLTSL